MMLGKIREAKPEFGDGAMKLIYQGKILVAEKAIDECAARGIASQPVLSTAADERVRDEVATYFEGMCLMYNVICASPARRPVQQMYSTRIPETISTS